MLTLGSMLYLTSRPISSKYKDERVVRSWCDGACAALLASISDGLGKVASLPLRKKHEQSLKMTDELEGRECGDAKHGDCISA